MDNRSPKEIRDFPHKMKSRIDLAEYFKARGFKKGAEVGVADGRYSKILCETIPNLELYCIDPWEPYEKCWRGKDYQKNAYEQAKEKLSGYNAELMKMTSIEGSLEIPDKSLDFVFIDGAHTFDHVITDVVIWSRKVRNRGIVSGHDYCHFTNSGIVEAVNIYTQIHRIELNLIQRNQENFKDDRQPCWWFVKRDEHA